MRGFVGFFGSLTAISFGISVFNYFIKWINKNVINKLDKKYDNIKKYYRLLMKTVVKYHKYFGITAGISSVIHLILSINTIGISILGLISFVLIWIVALMGIVNVYLAKTKSRGWVKAHRTLAFLLILSIIVHVMFKHFLIIRL